MLIMATLALHSKGAHGITKRIGSAFWKRRDFSAFKHSMPAMMFGQLTVTYVSGKTSQGSRL